MKQFRIPFSILPMNVLKSFSYIFLGIGRRLEKIFPFLDLNLKQIRSDLNPKEYISLCIASTFSFFIFAFLFLILIFFFIEPENYLTIGLFSSLIFTLFVFFQQIYYPKLFANRNIRDIENNLLDVLQDMQVQLNAGAPLFDILVNISTGDYGVISKEFKAAIKEINVGNPQIEVLEEMGSKNPSLFFRRVIWQIVNGMKAGSDISSIIKEIIEALSEQQIVQIQNYGGQLNPLAMFYMLIAIILPSLGITFLIVITSFTSISEFMSKLIFGALLGFVIFFQIMFLGIIKSRRPSLLRG